MAAIHDLIAQVADARLRDRITAEWTKAMRDRKVGVVVGGHLPGVANNVGRASGPARFAVRHGWLFGRVQLIRKQSMPGVGGRFGRFAIHRIDTIQRLLLLNQAGQLDALFEGVH